MSRSRSSPLIVSQSIRRCARSYLRPRRSVSQSAQWCWPSAQAPAAAALASVSMRRRRHRIRRTSRCSSSVRRFSGARDQQFITSEHGRFGCSIWYKRSSFSARNARSRRARLQRIGVALIHGFVRGDFLPRRGVLLGLFLEPAHALIQLDGGVLVCAATRASVAIRPVRSAAAVSWAL